jgi:hypothetical protein
MKRKEQEKKSEVKKMIKDTSLEKKYQKAIKSKERVFKQLKKVESILEKSLEIRLRNTLKRRGFILSKSRRRDPQALDYGGYWIIDGNKNLVAGDEFGISLEEVDEWVKGMGKGE